MTWELYKANFDTNVQRTYNIQEAIANDPIVYVKKSPDRISCVIVFYLLSVFSL